MTGTSIDQLNISARAKGILHRNGIHFVEELLAISIDDLSCQKNVGKKTIKEINDVINSIAGEKALTKDSEGSESADKESAEKSFSQAELLEMARHPVEGLCLSVRSYHALLKEGYKTIDQVAVMTEYDYAQLRGAGKKSVDDIKFRLSKWIEANHFDKAIEEPNREITINDDLKCSLVNIAEKFGPILRLSWISIYGYASSAEVIDCLEKSDQLNRLRILISIPEIGHKLKLFCESISVEGVISKQVIQKELSSLGYLLDVVINILVAQGILCTFHDHYLITRNCFAEAYEKYCDPADRASQMLLLRVKGESLKDIGKKYSVTRERARQITEKQAKKLPALFEDYFHEPFEFFRLQKNEFLQAFSDITEEGYEFLSIRYARGKEPLSTESLKQYNGNWRELLSEYLQAETIREEKRTISKTGLVMKFLISEGDTPLSMEELVDEYYKFVCKKGYPANRLEINLRSIGNHLRNTRGVVFNKNNKVRYCNANPQLIWDTIDFSLYKNTVISAELVFKDYKDLMDELDIRDGYELFYIIKASLQPWGDSKPAIRCRRVPILLIGEASEERQAMKLLREISPVSFSDYFEAYEDRFGVRRDSAQGNPAIFGAISPYYVDGRYIIDVPSINELDVSAFTSELDKKSIWFIEEIEELFEHICIHSTRDAINAAAFRQIGYELHTSYAYKSTYGTLISYLDQEVFSNSIVDLSLLDRRLVNLSMFGSVLDRKKKSLEFIETAPKILMSSAKVEELYGLRIEDIRQIQALMNRYYSRPYFNGRSTWDEIKEWPLIRMLRGNDWMLTCIMRQQDSIGSLSVAGGIILSAAPDTLSLSKVCTWLAMLHGKMTIRVLEKVFNETFGTRVSGSKLAEKLKSSGDWAAVITDSMDDYIDSLIDENLANDGADDLLQEEFY